MAKGTTRFYRVPAEPKQIPFGDYNKTFLVDATSRGAAERHVAAKYIGKAEIASTKEVAELMKDGVLPEEADK